MRIFKKKSQKLVQAEGDGQVTSGEGQVPDYRRMMQRIAGDQKGNALQRVLSSDKDNAVKASIHNVFSMSAADLWSRLEDFDDEVEASQYFLNGRIREDEGGYRINSRAEEGRAVSQYIDGYKAWVLLNPAAGQALDSGARLKEGDKK